MPAIAEKKMIRDRLQGRSLVFVGMMGCGKSAIGKMVASKLGLPYADSDEEIARAAGMTVPEIFEKFGEPYFRKGEERVVQRLLSEGPGVISLGGGAFLSPQTRETIGESGISIWLKADADLLLSRVMRRPGKRPLLMTSDPRTTLMNLLEARTPVYEHADIHVESSRDSKFETRDGVLGAVGRWLENHPRDHGEPK